MTDTATQPSDDEIVNDEVSDELLESAAAEGKLGAYTVAFCTGGYPCPA